MHKQIDQQLVVILLVARAQAEKLYCSSSFETSTTKGDGIMLCYALLDLLGVTRTWGEL